MTLRLASCWLLLLLAMLRHRVVILQHYRIVSRGTDTAACAAVRERLHRIVAIAIATSSSITHHCLAAAIAAVVRRTTVVAAVIAVAPTAAVSHIVGERNAFVGGAMQRCSIAVTVDTVLVGSRHDTPSVPRRNGPRVEVVVVADVDGRVHHRHICATTVAVAAATITVVAVPTAVVDHA
jgi:hypothetical protein